MEATSERAGPAQRLSCSRGPNEKPGVRPQGDPRPQPATPPPCGPGAGKRLACEPGRSQGRHCRMLASAAWGERLTRHSAERPGHHPHTPGCRTERSVMTAVLCTCAAHGYDGHRPHRAVMKVLNFTFDLVLSNLDLNLGSPTWLLAAGLHSTEVDAAGVQGRSPGEGAGLGSLISIELTYINVRGTLHEILGYVCFPWGE